MSDDPDRPLVTVVVPVLDGVAWVGRQLDAVAAQEFDHPWEVVVVDNGSTDGSQALVGARAAGFPVPLLLVDGSARAGVPHARNVGALAARGEIIAYCDCDDVVAPGWLAAAHRGTLEASVVGGVNRVLREPLDPEAPVINPGGVIRGSFGNAVVGCNFAVRRRDLIAVGGFDESLPPYGCEDFEFSIRANDAGLVVVGAEDMVIYFRRTEGARQVLRKTYTSALAEAVVWSRHPARYGSRLRAGRLVTSVVRWPFDSLARMIAERSLSGRSRARDLMNRLGHLVGWWTLVRRGRAGGARLIRPPDD